MGRFTSSRPKCLVEIGREETILSRQIRLLISCGVEEFVITTGPWPELIETHVRDKFGSINVTYVNNPDYESTNYIYSMHLSRHLLREDILLLHGDLVMDQKVIETLIDSQHPNAVVVSRPSILPEKDFKARIAKRVVTKIGISLRGEDCVFLLPFYKISQNSMDIWLSEIERFISLGKKNVYAEEAFNERWLSIGLFPVDIGNLLCMEIDDAGDLENALNRLRGKEE
jgi:choline kinase